MKNKRNLIILIIILLSLLIISCKTNSQESVIPTSPVEVTTETTGNTTTTTINVEATGTGSSSVIVSQNCGSARIVYGIVRGRVNGNTVTAETVLYGAENPINATITGSTMFSKSGNGAFTGMIVGVFYNGKLYASGGMPLDEYNADRNAVISYWDNITITQEEQKATNNINNLPNSLMAKAELQSASGNGKFEIYIQPKIQNAKFLNSVFIVNSIGSTYTGKIYSASGETGEFSGAVRGGTLRGKTWGKLNIQVAPDGSGYSLDASGNFFGKGNVALNGTAIVGGQSFQNTWINVYGRFESCNDNVSYGTVQGSLSDNAAITINPANGQSQTVTTSAGQPEFVFNNVPEGEATIVYNTNGQVVTQTVQVVAGQVTQINPFGSTQELMNSLKGQVFELVNNGNNTTVADITGTASGNAFYTREINVPVRNFSDGFPGITDRYEWFGIRYDGTITAPVTGKYIFKLTSDDGAVLYINQQMVVNNDKVHSVKSATGEIELTAGQTYNICIKYFQGPRYQIALVVEAQIPNGQMKLFNMADFAR